MQARACVHALVSKKNTTIIHYGDERERGERGVQGTKDRRERERETER